MKHLHKEKGPHKTYRLALLVLAPVQNCPVDLSRVPLGQEGGLALAIQELENLLKAKYYDAIDMTVDC